jgi:hypothetical protein
MEAVDLWEEGEPGEAVSTLRLTVVLFLGVRQRFESSRTGADALGVYCWVLSLSCGP